MKRQQLRPGTAAVIKVAKTQSIAVVEQLVVQDTVITTRSIDILDVEPGRYIVVPIKLWEQTVRAAMLAAEAPPPPDDELPPTRQQRRAKLRN